MYQVVTNFNIFHHFIFYPACPVYNKPSLVLRIPFFLSAYLTHKKTTTNQPFEIQLFNIMMFETDDNAIIQ